MNVLALARRQGRSVFPPTGPPGIGGPFLEIVRMSNPFAVKGRLTKLHTGFLAILPAINKHAVFAFRFMFNVHDREDAIQETIAVAWAWYRRLAQRRKDAGQFPTRLAFFASRHVKCGRHLCGQENTKDVLSPTARLRRGFRVEALPSITTMHGSPWQEALVDNTHSEVIDQVIFRVDFFDWLRSWPHRHQRIIAAMALGERTQKLARRFALSPARISQLRREYHADWSRFCGDVEPLQKGLGRHPQSVSTPGENHGPHHRLLHRLCRRCLDHHCLLQPRDHSPAHERGGRRLPVDPAPAGRCGSTSPRYLKSLSPQLD